MRPVLYTFLLLTLSIAACKHHWSTPPRVLIFSRTSPHGYRHQSIEAGKAALVELCKKNGIWADTTENQRLLTESNLRRYAAVIFLSTNGEVLDPDQEADFERYIQAGGGFVGVHATSATEYTWHWFGGLVGAYFKDHPAIQDAPIEVLNCEHPATRHLDCTAWPWREEWYNFRNYEPDLTPLLGISDSSYTGGNTPSGKHLLAWCHEYDGGRAFYTALGHLAEAYADPKFQQHLLGGIQYAIGKNAPLNYSKCHTQRRPDQSRFVKTVVADHLAEPMELAQFPDQKIIVIERHGYLKLFDPAIGTLNTVAKLPVYSEMGDGLIGLAIDPNWQQNHWIYLYYSSLKDSLNQLSRFVFIGDTLDRASEKVILTVPVDRFNTFHAAGSLTFGPDGLLYLSTGDNTSPFASDGYSPADSRPGRKAFDARRSSANTNDLRGKILRIQIHPDGSYTCPPGNLFAPTGAGPFTHTATPAHPTQRQERMNQTPSPQGEGWGGANPTQRQKTTDQAPSPQGEGRGGAPTPQAKAHGRAEIYIMGCRNPFRTAVDSRRNILYWGEIGPDAGKTDTARGPMGHDEINQARKAGNYGWPLFVGNNQPYRIYDFETQKNGAYFNPDQPENTSPNNTGQRILPPAQSAMIWYPYGRNREFPMLGEGGRNAMAGPVYYCSDYPAATRLPDYYNDRLIIYDWMRGWLMAVTLDSLNNFHHIEPFADSVRLSRPMDMLIDAKGSIWVLEYGQRWYSSNDDARLSRIDFVRGNRPPVARLRADVHAGGAPFTTQFYWEKSEDYDRESLQFDLDFGDGIHQRWQSDKRRQQSIAPKKDNGIAHTYKAAGQYTAVLVVTDPTGRISTDRVAVQVGNAPPEVTWVLSSGNRSFYRPGDTLRYRIDVRDKEDDAMPPLVPSIAVEYIDKNLNPASLPARANAQENTRFVRGRELVAGSDCYSCHAVDRAVNGPAFEAVAERYRRNTDFAVATIYRKIIYGGTGNWGQKPMAAHPNIREEDAIEMAKWILALGDPAKPVQNLPQTGTYPLTAAKGTYIFRAGYRDKGGFGGIPALESGDMLVLRPNPFEVENCDARRSGVGNYKPFNNDTTVLIELKHTAWFAIKQVDLTAIQALTLRLGYGDIKTHCVGGRLEIRANSPDGPLLTTLNIASKDGPRMVFWEEKIAITPAFREESISKKGAHGTDLYFVFKNEANQGASVVAVDWVWLE